MDIRFRRGTSSYLSEQDPVLAYGEPCLEVDTGRVKYGDGVTPWSLLDYSTGAEVSFGTNNQATGPDSFAAGGSDNTASGGSAGVLGGNSNLASGDNSAVAGGENNEASGAGSVVLGGSDNIASGDSAVAVGGSGNVAEGDNSVAMGRDAYARNESQVAISSGMFMQPGDSQTSTHQLRATTQDDTPTRMLIGSGSGELSLPPGSAWAFEVNVSAYDGNLAAGSWRICGGIGRDFSGNTSLSAEPTLSSWAVDWPQGSGVEVSADDSSEALAITVTGVAGRTIRWVATVETTEVIIEEPLTSDMFVEVQAGASVSSMSMTVDGNAMFPSFDSDIHDYCVKSNQAFTSSANYTLTINGQNTTGTTQVNKCIHVKDGGKSYFVRILPSDMSGPASVTVKTTSYIPGYYLLCPNQGQWNYPYFVVYDSNGVPVWYMRHEYGDAFSLHAGWEQNRLMTNLVTGNNNRLDIKLGLNSLTAKSYNMINPDTRGGYHTWEIHESHAIKGPGGRKGNVIYESYDATGFYIQEQNPQGQIVWEWWSDDYFNTSYADYFHLNSIDVNPITGDVVLSCRHNGSVLAIDYQTKDIIWILEGSGYCHSGPLSSVAKQNMTANTHWLVPYNEPTVQGHPQYHGTDSQHDARWHVDFPLLDPANSIVSVSDNQTCAGRPARGVVYEIDLVNDRAIFRCHVYSPKGSTPWQGSYTLLKEANGTFSHVIDPPDQHPNLLEFPSGTDGMPTQTTSFVMDIPGNSYRTIKVREDFLNINYMRTTAGRIPTVV